MEMAKVAPGPPSTSAIEPPWARTSSAAMASPRPVPPGLTEPWKARKSEARAFSGRPGPVSATRMVTRGSFARGRDGQPADHRRIGIGVHRLNRIAAEIDQDTEELVGIGVDFETGRHLVLPGDHRILDDAEGVGNVVDQPAEGDQAAGGRRLAGAAIGERRLAIGDGAVERADELGREALHVGVGQAAEAVGEELGRGQHVPEIVIDLGDGEAEIGEMTLFAERPLQVALHGGQTLLGDADLVAAAARHDDAGGILRRLRKGDDVRGQAAHRPDQQPVDGEIEKAGGDDRDERRQPDDVDRIGEHGVAQRPVADDELEHGARARIADDAQRARLLGEERIEGIDDLGDRLHDPEIGGAVDPGAACRRWRSGGWRRRCGWRWPWRRRR